MNNQQKLLILSAVVGISAIGLLIILSRKKNVEKTKVVEGEIHQSACELVQQEEEMDFADLTAEDSFATAYETVVKLTVPKYAVGAIIGKGGENIRRLKKETGARLDFERESFEAGTVDKNAERILEIRGNRDRVRAAEIKLRRLIEEQPPIVTIEMSVPQEACGRIIGRGGESIREICQSSGAKVVVERTEDRSKPGLRKVTFTGTAKQIEFAREMVKERIEAAKLSKYSKMPNQASKPGAKKMTPSFPVRRLPNTEGYFNVFVSAFDVPNHVFVQVVTPESKALDKLTQEMTDYYNNNTTSVDVHKQLIQGVKVGELYCAPFEFDSLWYRACVTEIDSADRTASVFYVDFGDNGKVSLDELRTPKPEFLNIEAQAVECYLAGIEAKEEGWSDEAIDRFDSLSQCAQWSVLIARKVGYVEADGRMFPSLELIDTKQDEDINLAEAMIKEGFAQPIGTLTNKDYEQQLIVNNEKEGGSGDVVEHDVVQSQENGAQQMMAHDTPQETIVEPEMTQVQKSSPEMMSSNDADLVVTIVDELPDLEDVQPVDLEDELVQQGSEVTGRSEVTEMPVEREEGDGQRSEVTEMPVEREVEEIQKSEIAERSEDNPQLSDVKGESSKKHDNSQHRARAELSITLEDAKVKVQHSNDEVHKWIQKSPLDKDTPTGAVDDGEVEVGSTEREAGKTDDVKIDNNVEAARNGALPRIAFQNSMELAKENPVMVSDDEDSLSYMSARSELTITDTDDGNFKSAPDTPTNENESFKFPIERGNSFDYDIITTPVTSDDEKGIESKASKLEPAEKIESSKFESKKASKFDSARARFESPSSTPVNTRTPKYQIKVVDEKATPTSRQHLAAGFGVNPERIGKLSSSTPQFGDLKSSQSRLGGSGSMVGKETSI